MRDLYGIGDHYSTGDVDGISDRFGYLVGTLRAPGSLLFSMLVLTGASHAILLYLAGVL